MKMMNKVCALLVSAALCAGMAAPAFAFEGEAAPVEQPVLPEVVEDIVTVTDETSGALTPEGNLTLVDDYHTSYSDGSGQQFITLVSKSGSTFYLVIDRNAKGQQTVHFMNLVDESDLLALMEEEDADAYTAEKEAAAQAEPTIQYCKPYDLPYRCFLPLGLEGLLVAGRCISGTHRAHASYRVMSICMAMGEAVGIAAAMSASQHCTPRALDVGELQKRLESLGIELFD